MSFLWQCHISGPKWLISQAVSQFESVHSLSNNKSFFNHPWDSDDTSTWDVVGFTQTTSWLSTVVALVAIHCKKVARAMYQRLVLGEVWNMLC